jgi:hypothetical protein
VQMPLPGVSCPCSGSLSLAPLVNRKPGADGFRLTGASKQLGFGPPAHAGRRWEMGNDWLVLIESAKSTSSEEERRGGGQTY